MRFEERGRPTTFATFRVSGDNLAPEQVTKVLKFSPTLSYRKGACYIAGNANKAMLGRTGVWFLSTEKNIVSERLIDHLLFIFFVLGVIPNLFPQRRSAASDQTSVSDLASQLKKITDLQNLIRQQNSKAVVTCFWHGPVGAKPPTTTVTTHAQFLRLFSIDVETDFFADEVPHSSEGNTLAK